MSMPMVTFSMPQLRTPVILYSDEQLPICRPVDPAGGAGVDASPGELMIFMSIARSAIAVVNAYPVMAPGLSEDLHRMCGAKGGGGGRDIIQVRCAALNSESGLSDLKG